MIDFFHPSKSTFGKHSPDDAITIEPTVENAPEKGLTSIIIPAYFLSYPLFHQTGNCIGSIREHTKLPYEIILVINGDTGIGFKEEDYDKTYADKVIFNKENLGWTKAINQGIRASKGEYTCLMNNDVMVYDNWLEDMQEALTQVDLVMATPMYGMPYARAKEANELREKNLNEPLSDFNDFSCVLTRKQLFQEFGTFDESLFNYGSDLDFIRRIEAAGKKKASTKKVNIFHIIGFTSSGMSETPEQLNEAKAKLKEKWGE